MSTSKKCRARLSWELSVCRIHFYLALNPAYDCDYFPISCFSKLSSMILHGGRRGDCPLNPSVKTKWGWLIGVRGGRSATSSLELPLQHRRYARKRGASPSHPPNWSSILFPACPPARQIYDGKSTFQQWQIRNRLSPVGPLFDRCPCARPHRRSSPLGGVACIHAIYKHRKLLLSCESPRLAIIVMLILPKTPTAPFYSCEDKLQLNKLDFRVSMKGNSVCIGDVGIPPSK